MKSCRICNEEKEQEEFSKRGKGKLHTFCKKCANEYYRKRYDPKKESIRSRRKKEKNPDKIREQNKIASIKYRKENIEKCRACDRKSSKGRQQNRDPKKAVESVRKWQKKNPEKCRAADKVRYYIKKGKIMRPKQCQICGDEAKLQAHHHDYSKSLEVIFVCTGCHGYVDRVRRRIEEISK